MDMGLSTYFDPQLQPRVDGPKCGTPDYMCLNAHLGKSQYPADDVLALFFTAGALQASLPWSHLEDEATIEECKRNIFGDEEDMEEFLGSLPACVGDLERAACEADFTKHFEYGKWRDVLDKGKPERATNS